ncbi:hypothetical protein Hanom_Chr07g00634631 [Helianthus anomalus]
MTIIPLKGIKPLLWVVTSVVARLQLVRATFVPGSGCIWQLLVLNLLIKGLLGHVWKRAGIGLLLLKMGMILCRLYGMNKCSRFQSMWQCFYTVHTASCWARNCNLTGFTSDVHGGSKFGLHLFGIVTRVAFIWIPWCNAPQMSWAYVDWLRV